MIRRRTEPIDPKRMRVALAVAAALAIAGLALFFTRPHENRYEREARRITEAIVAGDLTPVAADFTPATRATFTRESVSLASRRFASLGGIRRVRETTAHDAAAGAHDVDVEFERGTLPEHLRYEIGGRIVTFRYDAPVRP